MSTLADTEEAVRDAVARFAERRVVALDVEGDGLFRYRAQLCTVQLGADAGEDIAVVDTLATSPLLLADVVEGDDVEKIVHDASFDVRLLRDVGVRFGRLYDTSVAARFLGEPATGLASLLEKHVGVKLEKEKQQADWGKRPLDAEELFYLENDVRHLEELADLLREAARKADIGLEVEEECRWVVSSAYAEAPDERVPWVRMKGALEAPPAEQAILREVALVRDRAAAKMNVPPFKIVRDDVLWELVRQRPKDRVQAERIRGLTRGRARRVMRDMVSAVRRGLAEKGPPREEIPERPKPPPAHERERRKRLQKSLSKWRRSEGEKRKVEAQVVLPGHCLKDVVAKLPRDVEELAAIPGMGEFRVERYGAAILKRVKAE